MKIDPASGPNFPPATPSISALIAELEKYAQDFQNAVNSQNSAAASQATQNELKVYNELLKLLPNPNATTVKEIGSYLNIQEYDLQNNNWYGLQICAGNALYYINQLKNQY